MSEEQYITITSYIRKNKFREKSIVYLCNLLPLFFVFIYIISILILIINNNKDTFLFIAVPASNFLLISIFRKIINKPRPYDIFNYEPIIKHSSGKSFPSRHTSSAFVIAVSYFYVNHIYLGIFMFITAIIIGLSRIICGIHFPKDIISAALISIIWAIAGFNLIL